MQTRSFVASESRVGDKSVYLHGFHSKRSKHSSFVELFQFFPSDRTIIQYICVIHWSVAGFALLHLQGTKNG